MGVGVTVSMMEEAAGMKGHQQNPDQLAGDTVVVGLEQAKVGAVARSTCRSKFPVDAQS